MKFAAFKEEIAKAKHHIHLEYYIIRDDELGNQIIELLTQKATEGVEIRAIFDAAGTFSVKKRFFYPAEKSWRRCKDLFSAQGFISQYKTAF